MVSIFSERNESKEQRISKRTIWPSRFTHKRRATGWASDETDIGFEFEDGYLSEKGIKAAESLAASFEREAYYSYLQPDKGAEEEIIPWVMSIVIGWAGGKLLDWVVKKLKEPSNKQIANQISKEWSETESSGEVNIRIRDQQDDLKSADIIIPGYPGNINEITEKKISELKEKTH